MMARGRVGRRTRIRGLMRSGVRRRSRRASGALRSGIGTWWWIVTVRGGQPFLRGPYSQFQAERINDKQDVRGEVVPLRTKDPDRATRMLKEMRLEEEDMPFEEAVKKFRHPGGKTKEES